LLAALLIYLRRLGIPFIGTRGLGAVGIPFGRQNFLSVGWRTGQPGAPPDTVRCLISFHKCCSRPLLSWSRWRTGHCPVHTGQSGAPCDRWLGHASRPDCAADRWPNRPLAHRTVRCTPDSPVNFSRTSLTNSRERPFHAESAWRTGQSGVPD
jgi:hypothetical protein